jgi:hypothetical protein
LEGYTVLIDTHGGITYAHLDEDGRFTSTGVSIAELPPEGLPRHLQEKLIKRREMFKERFNAIRKNYKLWTYGPNAGLLMGRQRNIGTVRGLTIIVEFSDIHAAVSVMKFMI